MKKKGFTLIELLAVIVILAIIMVIAVPRILDVIENARESAARSSIKLVKDAIRTQVSSSVITDSLFNKEEDGCYIFNFPEENANAQNLKLNNKDKISGSIKYCNGRFSDDTLTFDGNSSSKVYWTPKYFKWDGARYIKEENTTDYNTLFYYDGVTQAKVFVGMDEQEDMGICILKSNKLECFKSDSLYYQSNREHLISLFEQNDCYEQENDGIEEITCNSELFYCNISSNGYISCRDNIESQDCSINASEDYITCSDGR